MRPRRFIVLVLVVVLGIFGFGLVLFHYDGPAIVAAILSAQKGEGLSFEFEPCNEGASDVRDTAPTINWESSRIVRISGIAESNCATRWIVGDYSVAGDTITLHYQAILSGYALCDCAHKVTYRIDGLPKKDYRVNLRAQPAIPPIFWWAFPWKAIGLAVLLLSIASGWGMLVLRQRHRGSATSAQMVVGLTRREIVFIYVVLALAAAVSTVFWYQAVSAEHTALMNELMVERLGDRQGREDADKDFAAGTPRWYRFRYSGDVPEDKVDRKTATMDGGGTADIYMFNRAFVDAYNRRIDDLVESKRRRPAKKG